MRGLCTLVVVMVLVLWGCIDLKQARVTPEHRQLKNDTAIVVFLDSAPRLVHLQLSALDSTATTALLDGWDVDSLITQFLADRMRAMGLNVKSVDQGYRDLPDPYDSSMSYPNLDRMRGALAAWGKDQGLDMVVAVYRQVEQDFIGDSIENLVGYGLVRHGEDRTDAYAAVYIDVVDTKGGGLIGNSDGFKDIAVDNSTWRAAFSVDQTPIPIAGEEAARMTAKLEEALTGAVLLGAQEAGLSH